MEAFRPELNRRQLLRSAAIGVGASSGWLRAFAASSGRRPAKSVIVLWLDGGPATIDLWDLKPGHRNGGPFRDIATKAPGLRICEHLPGLAQHGHDLGIIRSMTSKEGDHEHAMFFLRTGYIPQGGVRFPAVGAVVAKELGAAASEVPNFVSIAPGRNSVSVGGGYLGPGHAPLIIGEGVPRDGAVVDESLAVPDLALPRDVSEQAHNNRLALLAEMEQRFQAERPSAVGDSLRSAVQRATRLMRPEAAAAFQLNSEPAKLRDAYGRNLFGQGCLLARRLVERGVPFVEVTLDGWDTHQDNFARVKELCGTLDAAFSALLSDLKQRGLLESTLVICQGEFGRTPKINGQAGRDHWPATWSVVLAGGGLKTGQAIGRTNPDGLTVEDAPISVPDLIATVACAVAIDPQKQNVSNVGRPIRVASPEALAIQELL